MSPQNLVAVVSLLLFSQTELVYSRGRNCGVGSPTFSDVQSLKTYLLFSLECRNWEVRVRMLACRVRELGLQAADDIFISHDPEDNVVDLNPNCKFKVVSHPLYGELYETKFKFDECGMEKESPLENFDEYLYQLNFRFGGYADGTISRVVSGFLGFSCWYNLNPSLFIGRINPNAFSYRVNNAISASPSTAITIESYSDVELKHKLSADDPFITIPQYFYVSAKVEGGGRKLILQAEKCWATPTPNPSSRKKKNLVFKGCPASSLASSDDVLIITNYESSRVLLGIRTFLWPGFTNGQEIYVHCTLNICDSTDESNTCTTKVCQKRKRSITDGEMEAMVDTYTEPTFAISIGVNASSCTESLCEDICTIINGLPTCMCDTGRVLQQDGISCSFWGNQLAKPSSPLGSVIVEEISQDEFEHVKISAVIVCAAAVFTSLIYGLYFYRKTSTSAKDYLPPDEKC